MKRINNKLNQTGNSHEMIDYKKHAHTFLMTLEFNFDSTISVGSHTLLIQN